MNQVLREIFKSSTVTGPQGEKLPLHSSTSESQCKFLEAIIKQTKARIGVEIGLAYGISSLAICEALNHQENPQHHIIDPLQDDWQNIGLLNLEKAGFLKNVKIYRDYSHAVLPKILASGLKADFAYADTTKVFDILMVDVFYLHKILRIGGILVLDDCNFPGIRKVARLLCRHPGWKVHSCFEPYQTSAPKKLLSKICRLIPWKEKWFSPDLVQLDVDLGIHAHCLAFEKICEDDRHWAWFANF